MNYGDKPIFLVSKCKRDGSTPLGECLEIEIQAEWIQGYNLYQSLLVEFSKQYPEWEIVSWGLKPIKKV